MEARMAFELPPCRPQKGKKEENQPERRRLCLLVK